MLNVSSEHPFKSFQKQKAIQDRLKKIIQKKNLNMNSLSCIKPRKLPKMISSIEIFLKLLTPNYIQDLFSTTKETDWKISSPYLLLWFQNC